VRMTRGAWKGYHGTVKATTEGQARVELHGKQKMVLVPKEVLYQLHGSHMGFPPAGGAMGASWAHSDGSRTPSASGAPSELGSQLKNDGFRTPAHTMHTAPSEAAATSWAARNESMGFAPGSRTPMHGSQTPMHDPFGGSMSAPGTPMHMTDGSGTPSHNLWDPSVATPHRPSTPADSNYDSFDSQWAQMGGGAGSASPFHAGGSNAFASSFAGSNPFENPTGGGGLGSFATGGGGSFLGDSPFGAPGAAGSDMAPGSGTPGAGQWTPGTPSSEAPSSIEGGALGGGAAPALPEGIVVKCLADDAKGAIVDNAGGKYTITIVETEERRDGLGRAEIEVVRPAKREKLLIIDGEWRGSKGTLIGIDGADGIVKMAENSDIKILYLDACAKLVDQSK